MSDILSLGDFVLPVKFVLDSVWTERRHLFYKGRFVAFVTWWFKWTRTLLLHDEYDIYYCELIGFPLCPSVRQIFVNVPQVFETMCIIYLCWK